MSTSNRGRDTYNRNQRPLNDAGFVTSNNSQNNNPFDDPYHIPAYQPPAGPPPGRSGHGENDRDRKNPYDTMDPGPSRGRHQSEDEDSGDEDLPPYTPPSRLSRPRSASNLPEPPRQYQSTPPSQTQQYAPPQNQGFLADPRQQQQQQATQEGRRSLDDRGYPQNWGYNGGYNGTMGGGHYLGYPPPTTGPNPPPVGYPPVRYAYDDDYYYGRLGRGRRGRRAIYGRRRVGPLGTLLLAETLL